jgi:TRAP-type C4-dicarboxylate transport system permease small subunit
MINRIKSAVDKTIEYLLVVLMAIMVLNVLWQVFSRFILNSPSSFTEELARYLLIWVGLIAAGYVAGRKMHLAIDYLVNKLSKGLKSKIELLTNLLIILFALFVMVIGGFNLVSLTVYLEQMSSALQIQLGYVYLAVPISGLLIIFYSAVNIYDIYTNQNSTNEKIMVN